MNRPEAGAPGAGAVVVVFGGGGPPHPAVVTRLPARPSAVIAADSGLDHARALGWRVDVVVGDFDSVSPSALAAATDAGTVQDRHPTAKDHTDLELALTRAWAQASVAEVVVVASAVGRFDHALTAAMALALPAGAAVRTSGYFGAAQVVVVRPGLPWQLDGPPGDLVTLVALHGPAEGIRTEGLRYALRDETLLPSSTRGVSNELTGGPARVELRAGVLLGIRPTALGAPEEAPPVIKYLGSKRRLVPVLAELWATSGARRGLDLFTGTTRVAQAWKAAGGEVTAVDRTRFAHLFARCYVEADAHDPAMAPALLQQALDDLDGLPGEDGYVTEVFCRAARYFTPENGRRIDAVRRAIDERWAGTPLWPVLLTALVEAADRVDSTAGVQMAYLKAWAPRALRPLRLQVPTLLAGTGRAVRGDAEELAGRLGDFHLAYLDPPYNQHRYETNYHVWETIVAGDEPAHYGVACKRLDCRDPAGRSAFNSRPAMPAALGRVLATLPADLVVVSGSSDGWLGVDELVALCEARGTVEVLRFPTRRYVGATIGVHSPGGVRVGQPGPSHTTEHLVVSGTSRDVARALGRSTAVG